MVKRRFAIAFVVVTIVLALAGLARRSARIADELAPAPADVPEPPASPGRPEPSDVDADEGYVTLRTLEEARTMDHTAVVMQGGGNEQIYLTVPVKHVACDEATLRAMSAMLDALEWNDAARASLSFELAPIGSGIFGGMGGGSVIDGVWMHPRFEAAAMLAPIAAVLYGRQSLDEVRPEIPRELPPQPY